MLSSPAFVDVRTVVTFPLIVVALPCVMADAGAWPHIVHGPDYGFVGGQYLSYIVQ